MQYSFTNNEVWIYRDAMCMLEILSIFKRYYYYRYNKYEIYPLNFLKGKESPFCSHLLIWAHEWARIKMTMIIATPITYLPRKMKVLPHKVIRTWMVIWMTTKNMNRLSKKLWKTERGSMKSWIKTMIKIIMKLFRLIRISRPQSRMIVV